MIRRNSSKLKNTKGFTLAELLTVVGITAILAAIGIIALVRYADALKLTKMDNTAKEIFIASQNHLSQAEDSGTLSDIIADSDTDPGLLGTKMTVRPSDMSADEWKENGDDYYYIIYDPSRSSELKSGVLAAMLPYGAIDDDIRSDGYYIIEYNVKTANVYGVFYNDKSKFTGADEKTDDGYLNSTSERVRPSDNTTSALDKAKEYRLKYGGASGQSFTLGYYGGAMVDLFGKDITAPALSISNGSRLKVTITDANYFDTAEKDGDTKQLKTGIKLRIKGVESGNTKTLDLALADAADGAVPVKKDAAATWWSVKKVTASDNRSALEYTVYLDDVTSSDGHFSDICDNLIPGENIVVTAECTSSSVLTNVRNSESGYTNSLFGDVKADKNAGGDYTGSATAEVSNIRHIENLDPLVSALPQSALTSPSSGKKTNINKYVITDVLQTADIDYRNFASDVKDSDGTFSIYRNSSSAATALTSDGYWGIYNYNIGSYDGNGKDLKNLTGNNTATTEFVPGGMNEGLFRFAAENLTIKDLTVTDPDFTANKNAAGLIAEVQTNGSHKPSELTVKNVLIKGGSLSGTINTGNVGGMLGYVKTSGSITVSNCAASAYCTSKYGDAGGLIGEIGSKASVSNSYSGGHTTDGSYSSSDYNVISGTSIQNSSNSYPSAGGFLGKTGSASNVSITNCYSTCSADGYYSGGFIGSDRYGGSGKSISSCYSVGLVNGTVSGCFGGALTKSTISDTYYLDGINSTSMSALGSYSGNSGSVVAASYGDTGKIADTSSNRETYAFDSSLGDYPFRMVNNTGASSTSVSGAHYGDWQDLKETGSVSFAYREKDSTGVTSWKMLTATLGDDGKIATTMTGSLVTARGRTITSTGYGLLSPTKASLSSMSKGSDSPKASDFYDSPETVTVGGKRMYFYPVKESVVNGFSTSSRYMTTPKFYLGSGKSSDYVQFSFNPLFAAAMSQSGYFSFGTSSNPYQVRTAWQFTNMVYYPSRYYQQTCDIDMSGYSFTKPVIDGTFSGTYNALYSGTTGYSITGFKQTISSGSSAGLFENNYGTIQYLTLTDSSISVTNDAADTGAIVGTNYYNGKLLYCSASNVDISVTPDSIGSDMNIGSIAGSNTTYSTISNCSASGKITFRNTDAADNKSTIRIGGAVGYSDSYDYNISTAKISDSSADVDISVNYGSNTDGLLYAGGFAGQLYKGDITGCSSRSSITDTTNCPDADECYEYLGGFAGNINSRSSSYQYIRTSWSRSYIANSSKNAAVGGFTGKSSGLNAPMVVSCYASTFFKPGIVSFNDRYLTLFTGYEEDSGNRYYYNCHAVERSADSDTSDAISLSSYGFTDGSAYLPYTCYIFSTNNSHGEYAIDDSYSYRILYSYLGSDTWETVNGYYPTLIDNPENL